VSTCRDPVETSAREKENVLTRLDVEPRGGEARALCLVMACALAGIFIIEVLLCLTPPVSRDALIHHLAIPKLWIHHGGFFETPWAAFSYFPMNIDLLYLVPLLFGNDLLPAFIHLLFGWGTGYLVYGYLKGHAGRLWGLLGLLVFVSTPMVVRLSITAYVDLGMIFFTTASVLSYLRWRDGGYEDGKWLLLSAVCMGLAAGTKYNALISWLFLGGAVCFLYARDTGKQLQALRWGLIFFLVALVTVSPWLVKNLILKGNPIYPLMDNVFALIHVGRETAGFLTSGDSEAGGYSLFRIRSLLYGEEAWQILLLPLRIFFEGRDHSPQHFDGVLSPLFALAIPFAFIGSQRGHRSFFFLFIVFVFTVSAFMADLRIRYILPTVPFMTILAVMGIRNGTEWLAGRRQSALRLAGVSALFAVALLLAANLVYLGTKFTDIRPLPYLLGAESRDEFLSRQVGSYPATAFINRNLPDDAVVYLLYLSGRGYYLDRDYIHHVGLETAIVKAMVRSSTDAATLAAFLRSLGGTHILMREELLIKALADNFPDETVRGVLEKLALCLIKVYESNGHAVYEIRGDVVDSVE
jgi:4-amino-4-deoxy-L-arabinose transferase-like glycosyltransferase